MYVACPSCRSLFQIQPGHLRAAGGEVRCGMCDNIFNASDAAFESPQQALEWAEQHVAREIDDLVHRALDQLPAGAVNDDQPPHEAQSQPQIEVAVADEGEAPCEPAPRRVTHRHGWHFHADADFYAQPQAAEYCYERQLDSGASGAVPPASLFAEEFGGAGAQTRWGAAAAALLLALLLLAQYTYVERYRLASDASLRPALEMFCGVLRCDLPLRHDPGRMEMVQREVRDHPNVADALLINAAFVNRAPFRQSYPLFQISFSDVSGTLVALRRFRPAEYLDKGSDPSAGLAPGEQARLMLEVIDPGERAVSFQFDFL